MIEAASITKTFADIVAKTLKKRDVPSKRRPKVLVEADRLVLAVRLVTKRNDDSQQPLIRPHLFVCMDSDNAVDADVRCWAASLQLPENMACIRYRYALVAKAKADEQGRVDETLLTIRWEVVPNRLLDLKSERHRHASTSTSELSFSAGSLEFQNATSTIPYQHLCELKKMGDALIAIEDVLCSKNKLRATSQVFVPRTPSPVGLPLSPVDGTYAPYDYDAGGAKTHRAEGGAVFPGWYSYAFSNVAPPP